MILREYQNRTVSDLFDWWTKHQEVTDIPLLVLPTAAGKSIICAEVVRQMWDQWPDFHPRTVVLVPSKELAEQNAEKLQALLPPSIKVGFVSASLGKKQHDADVIVATIGSIAKSAHKLGDIKAVIIDEAHLVDTKAQGMYRTFLAKLSDLCEFRTVGMTATPFRGNGVWLTDGDDPLFTGFASRVTMRELLDAGFIAPLVPPPYGVVTQIDASNVGISNGDYKIGELSIEVEKYLDKVATESIKTAQERKKWIAFTPSVVNADSLCNRLNSLGVLAAVVCGETPKLIRENLIRDFRNGEIRCLVTVLALSTGFDVPDVDCIIWCRPTQSPVLYVQGMGRGTRIADGKTDCLVLDFTDTVARMGTVDTVTGRAKRMTSNQEAPFCICPNCGERNHATALTCTACGATIREEEVKPLDAKLSYAALLSAQSKQVVVWHDITKVEYHAHKKEGKPDSLRVDYYSGILKTASEWVCFEHTGYAREKAEQWWIQLTRYDNEKTPCLSILWGKNNMPWVDDYVHDEFPHIPKTVVQALECIKFLQQSKNASLASESSEAQFKFNEPKRIATRQNGKYTEVRDYEFS